MREPSGIGFNPGQMNTLRMLVHLPNFAKLYVRLFQDKRVSWLPKAVLVLGLAYVALPSDLMPDLLIPLGWVDDSAVAIGALWSFIKLCPRRIVQEHVEIIDQGG
ncbi:MAG: DUF1232 domain-containing protein [Armatimonadota bacterium]|nr:DUF1232 domain-containing protein [Armatimonadota bacterium]